MNPLKLLPSNSVVDVQEAMERGGKALATATTITQIVAWHTQPVSGMAMDKPDSSWTTAGFLAQFFDDRRILQDPVWLTQTADSMVGTVYSSTVRSDCSMVAAAIAVDNGSLLTVASALAIDAWTEHNRTTLHYHATIGDKLS